MNSRIPDHVLDNRSAGGPSVGKMKGVLFGTNTDRERHEEYLKHFFKEIDKGVHHILPGRHCSADPGRCGRGGCCLSPCEQLSSLDRTSCFQGSPDAFEPNELHDRAMEIAREIPPPPLQKALDQLKEVFGTKLALSNMDEIVQRADEGRVADLLLGEESGAAGQIC